MPAAVIMKNEEEAGMNTTTSEPLGRREFLKSAAVAGGA